MIFGVAEWFKEDMSLWFCCRYEVQQLFFRLIKHLFLKMIQNNTKEQCSNKLYFQGNFN